MKKFDFIVILLLLITSVLNLVINVDWLMIITYVLVFGWSLWHYKMGGTSSIYLAYDYLFDYCKFSCSED